LTKRSSGQTTDEAKENFNIYIYYQHSLSCFIDKE
jgi:hypothetical protein